PTDGRHHPVAPAFHVVGGPAEQRGPIAPVALPTFGATAGPSATLSPSAPFPDVVVIGRTLLRQFRSGTRRASPVARRVLAIVPSLLTPPEWFVASVRLRRSILPSPYGCGLGPWGPALSIARWGHISTMATFHEAPLRSRTAGFPGSGSGLGPARHFSGSGLLPSRWSLSGDTHPLHSGEICSRPRPNARAALTQLCVWGHTSKSRPPSTQSPFARRLVGASSRNAWES